MSKNLLLCVGGILLGFAVGFFVTNSLTRPAAGGGAMTAGPLDDGQAAGELPPGHPEIGDAAGDADAPPAGSASPGGGAEEQAAKDRADRAPKDFDAQVAAAQLFYGRRDYDESARYLDRALALRPKDFDALVLMGNVKYDDEEYDAAAGYYERALSIKPDAPDVRTDLGNTYFNRKDFERALAEYRKSVAADPAHVNSWRNIAAAALNLRDKAAASEAVERLAALDPQNPDLDNYRQRVAQLP